MHTDICAAKMFGYPPSKHHAFLPLPVRFASEREVWQTGRSLLCRHLSRSVSKCLFCYFFEFIEKFVESLCSRVVAHLGNFVIGHFFQILFGVLFFEATQDLRQCLLGRYLQ